MKCGSQADSVPTCRPTWQRHRLRAVAIRAARRPAGRSIIPALPAREQMRNSVRLVSR
jgi:hypothetical protein